MLQMLLGKNDEVADPSWTAPLDVLSCCGRWTREYEPPLPFAIRNLHVLHHKNPNSVEPVNHIFWGDSNCTDEKSGLLFDDDIRELGQLSFGIVVLDQKINGTGRWQTHEALRSSCVPHRLPAG